MTIKGNSLEKPLKEIIEQNPGVSLKDLIQELVSTNSEEICGILTKSMVVQAEKILGQIETMGFDDMADKSNTIIDIRMQLNDLFEIVNRIRTIVGEDYPPYGFPGLFKVLDNICAELDVLNARIVKLEYQ